jgi:hypothetical protein
LKDMVCYNKSSIYLNKNRQICDILIELY